MSSHPVLSRSEIFSQVKGFVRVGTEQCTYGFPFQDPVNVIHILPVGDDHIRAGFYRHIRGGQLGRE